MEALASEASQTVRTYLCSGKTHTSHTALANRMCEFFIPKGMSANAPTLKFQNSSGKMERQRSASMPRRKNIRDKKRERMKICSGKLFCGRVPSRLYETKKIPAGSGQGLCDNRISQSEALREPSLCDMSAKAAFRVARSSLVKLEGRPPIDIPEIFWEIQPVLFPK